MYTEHEHQVLQRSIIDEKLAIAPKKLATQFDCKKVVE